MAADEEWHENMTLFEDFDGNPFAVNPSEELPPDATPLFDTQAHLTATILNYVSQITGGVRGDLEPMISLAVAQTYKRLGYPDPHPYGDHLAEKNPSFEELRELPDPTPADFRATLTDICDDPEGYVRTHQIAQRAGHDALSLLRLLPQADEWISVDSGTRSTTNGD